MGEGEKDSRFPFRVGGVRFRVYGLGLRVQARDPSAANTPSLLLCVDFRSKWPRRIAARAHT